MCEWACYRIVSWNPNQGVYYYPEGTEVGYSYTSNSESGVGIEINGVEVCKKYNPNSTCSGSFMINGDTVMSVWGN